MTMFAILLSLFVSINIVFAVLNIDSNACLGGISWKVVLNNECTIESFAKAIEPRFNTRCKRFGLSVEEDIQLLLEASSEQEARHKIEKICLDAINRRNPRQMDWASISNKGVQHDSSFMYGGTSWNDEGELQLEKGNVRGSGAKRVRLIERLAKRSYISWPNLPTLSNCKTNAAMCCWVDQYNTTEASTTSSTDAGLKHLDDTHCDPIDGIDDCSESIDNNESPGIGNTDVCLIDLGKTIPSGQVNGGLTIFPNNTEGSVYCHGLAWPSNENYWNSLLKGNNLFQASVIQMKDKGYTKSLPGAPMCGCLEQMPVVSRADCTEAFVRTKFVLQYSANIPQLKADVYKQTISHQDCQGYNKTGDLSSFYEKLWRENHVNLHQKELFDSILVGENGCDTAIATYWGLYQRKNNATANSS